MDAREMKSQFILNLSAAIARLESEHKNPEAFPRVLDIHLAILNEMATLKEAVPIGHLKSTSHVVPSCALNFLSVTAGLLALHGAPIRIVRTKAHSSSSGRWVYHYRLVQI